MATDIIDSFRTIECCPDCGCLSNKGTLRCPECGTFHYDLASLPERDPPPIIHDVVEKNDLDPTLYSLNPNAPIPEEDTETEDIEDPTINWTTATTDFTLPPDKKRDDSSPLSEGG